MARRNVRLLRHKTEESSGKLILISHGDRDTNSATVPVPLASRKRKKISPNLDSLFPVIYNKYDTDLSGSEKN